MSPEQMEQAYRAGRSLRSIAGQARCAPETVRKMLCKRGVVIRRTGRPGGLTQAQIKQAKVLYVEKELSLVDVAARLGANPEYATAHLSCAWD